MGMRVRQVAKPRPQDGEHSDVVGGSTAKLRRLCNASIDEERKLPKERPSFAADRGTALHHVMEVAIRDNMSMRRVLERFAGTVYETPKMANAIPLDEKLLREKIAPALAFFDQTVHQEAEFWLEKKMPFPGIPEGKGTSDVPFNAYHLDGESGVIDWKFGDGIVVTADDNDQGRFYLCSARAAGLLPDRREYVFYIFQPATKLTPDKYASRAVYTAKDLDDFEADLVDAIDLWRAGKARHNVGPHCKDCKGKLVCPAYNKMLEAAVASDVKGLTTADLARMMRMRKGIEEWSKDVYNAAFRNASNGFEIPGYHLEDLEGNRVFKDETAAQGALARLGMPLDVRTGKVYISAPQALEWLKKSGTPPEQIARFEATHVLRPNKGEKLVEGDADPEKNAAGIGRLVGALKKRLAKK